MTSSRFNRIRKPI